MDFDPSNILEKLKENKLAIPAIAIGAGIGIYLLYKSGGSGASGLGDVVPEPQPATPTSPDTSSGVGDSGLADVQNQIAELTSSQQGLGASFAKSLNDLTDWINAQFAANQQAAQPVEQPYYSDGRSASELDSVSSLFTSGLSGLYSMLSVPDVPDFANLSPTLDKTLTKSAASLVNKFNATITEVKPAGKAGSAAKPMTNPIRLPSLPGAIQKAINVAKQPGYPIKTVKRATPQPFSASAFMNALGYKGASKAAPRTVSVKPKPANPKRNIISEF